MINIFDVTVADYPRLPGETGFEIHDRAHLLGCAYLNNKFQFNLNKITVIDHRAGYLDAQSCVFRPEGENVTFYKGSGKELYWGKSNYLTFEREKVDVKIP